MIRVYFEETEKKVIANVREEIIKRLCMLLSIEQVSSGGDCKVFFCTIVSRAGTDIEEKLRHIKPVKPTIVVVLHSRLNPESPVPNSSLHEKDEILILVDFIFNEDKGLLPCRKNEDSFSRVVEYMTGHSTQTVPPTALLTSWEEIFIWLQCLLGQDPIIGKIRQRTNIHLSR